MSKKINRALIQNILSKGGGVRSVSSEAVDWVIAVAEVAAKNLAESGRRTPAGRLMAPKMDPGLQSRQMMREPETKDYPGQQVDEYRMSHGGKIEWSDYNDWQEAVRSGATKLKFKEWREQGKNGTTD